MDGFSEVSGAVAAHMHPSGFSSRSQSLEQRTDMVDHIRLATNPPHPVLVEPDTNTEPSLDDRVLTALRESSTPIQRQELRRLLGVNNHRLGETLQQLERLGRIRRTSDGWSR